MCEFLYISVRSAAVAEPRGTSELVDVSRERGGTSGEHDCMIGIRVLGQTVGGVLTASHASCQEDRLVGREGLPSHQSQKVSVAVGAWNSHVVHFKCFE